VAAPLIALGIKYLITEGASSVVKDSKDDNSLARIAETIKRQLQKAKDMGADKAADIVYKEIIASITRERAIASSELLRSVRVTKLRSATNLTQLQVFSDSPYAAIVEEGRRAGAKMPPVNIIYDWMLQKGLEPSYNGAYLIARAISQRGIPAKKVFQKGVDRAEPMIDNAINVILSEIFGKG
jgi:hypothetical protein